MVKKEMEKVHRDHQKALDAIQNSASSELMSGVCFGIRIAFRVDAIFSCAVNLFPEDVQGIHW